MKSIELDNIGQHISKEEILEYQNNNNIILPKDYESFILKNNGGRLIKVNTFPMAESIIEKYAFEGIDCFLSFNEKTYYKSIDSYLKTYISRLPNDLFPIGYGPCGDLICLCIHGKNYGKVYFWDHEREAEEGREPTYDNVYLVANSFTDFINSLYEFKMPE